MIDVVEREDRETGTYMERLFGQHERRLGQFLVHVVRDRAFAEDLLQETFLAAWRARNELQAVVNPEAWL
jgi:DNA-directed RNA polymerase specialized sigma24 family protein